MRFQIVYSSGNKTFYSDIQAKHFNDALSFFEKVIGATVIEVREYVYEDLKTFKFDTTVNRKVVIKMFNVDGLSREVKIPLIKNSISDDVIISQISFIELGSKKIDKVSIKRI